jgi:hypothetical protein
VLSFDINLVQKDWFPIFEKRGTTYDESETESNDSAGGSVAAAQRGNVHIRWSALANSVTAASYGDNVAFEDPFVVSGTNDPALSSDTSALAGETLVPAYKVSFDEGDGSGTMDDAYVPASSPSYPLPTCIFLPPENMTFDHWEQRGDNASTPFSGTLTLTERYTTLTAAYKTTQPEPAGVSWTLESGVLTVSGKGAMEDYRRAGAPWFARRAEITSVVIGPDVTHISDYAFYACGAIQSVSIQGSGVSVGSRAFSYCAGLPSVVTAGDLSVFPDADDADAYAVTALSWAVGTGILGGTTDGNGADPRPARHGHESAGGSHCRALSGQDREVAEVLRRQKSTCFDTSIFVPPQKQAKRRSCDRFLAIVSCEASTAGDKIRMDGTALAATGCLAFRILTADPVRIGGSVACMKLGWNHEKDDCTAFAARRGAAACGLRILPKQKRNRVFGQRGNRGVHRRHVFIEIRQCAASVEDGLWLSRNGFRNDQLGSCDDRRHAFRAGVRGRQRETPAHKPGL